MSRATEIADRLIGTIGYNGDIDDIGSLTSDECKELDSLVFCCAICNWWCDISELIDEDITETVCVDCWIF